MVKPKQVKTGATELNDATLDEVHGGKAKHGSSATDHVTPAKVHGTPMREAYPSYGNAIKG